MEAASSIQSMNLSQDREKTMDYMTRQVMDYLSASPEGRRGRWSKPRQFMARNVFWLCGRSYGTYLSGVYMISKFFYVLNSVIQLVLLNLFLGRDYHVYGWEVLEQFLGYREFGINLRFPRVTWCDFNVRQLKTIHQHTVQCVLPINLFNEKIFIFVWFWLVLVAIITCINFLTWLLRCLFYTNRVDFVKVHLKRTSLLDNMQREAEVKKFARPFVTKFLKPDGVLLLHLLEQNANQIVTVELMVNLWNKYRSSHVFDGKLADEKEPLDI